MNKQRSWPILAVFLMAATFLPHQVQAAFGPPGQKLVADDGASGDEFGRDVSVSGDTALIGAGGKTYVFVQNADGAWQQQAKLPAGGSVSVFGDTAVISDYVFIRAADGTWKQQAKLIPTDGATAAEDGFGRSAALSGDIVVIGAMWDDDKGDDSGSAYIFIRAADGTWKQQAKLIPADGAPGDNFGNSVSISGNTVVIGSFQDDDKGDDSGSAYIFIRAADGTWKQQAKLSLIDGDITNYDNAMFGQSVSISGDTALIGATGFGKAYIFVRAADGTWKQQDWPSGVYAVHSVSISGNMAVVSGAYGPTRVLAQHADESWWGEDILSPVDENFTNQFGVSVSISGDTVIVSAPRDDDKGDKAGAAYIYTIPKK